MRTGAAGWRPAGFNEGLNLERLDDQTGRKMKCDSVKLEVLEQKGQQTSC